MSVLLLASLLTFALMPAHVLAQVPESKAFKLCVNCHGTDGLSQKEEVPIIAGTPVVVQEDALFAYRDEARDCGENPMMCKVSLRLSDEEIAEFAAYYAAQPFAPAGDEFDSALAEQGRAIHAERCIKCHGDETEIDLESGMLFGQKKGYLRYALGQYAAGAREQLPAMEKQTAELDEGQIEALLNYYASYRPAD